jgi:hypothetical protein
MKNPPERSRMLSLAEMQKCKVYFRRDIKISNPRKLFRYLANTLSEMGYLISYNTVNIQKDPIGDIGAVDAGIIAGKEEKIKVERERLNPIAIFLSLLGLSFLLVGLFGNNFPTFILGIALTSGAIYISLNFKVIERKIISCDINIYVKGIGEAYKGKHTEESTLRLGRDQVVTEMSLNLAGNVLLNYENAIRTLRTDMNLLLEKVDTFTE